MERYELEAWLGDNHGLTDTQVTELLAIANVIEARYPGEDDADERAAALTTAYRLMVEDSADVVDELAQQLITARNAEVEALAALQHAAVTLIPNGYTENAFANAAGVDRMTVRKWLGKR